MTTTSDHTSESLEETDVSHLALQGRHDGVKLRAVAGRRLLEPYSPVTPVTVWFDPAKPAATNGRQSHTPMPLGYDPWVSGVVCGNGHFNDPKLPFCTVCGLALIQATGLRTGIRPPLGVLNCDDGGVHPIDYGGMVVGRSPWRDELVGAGIAVPLQFADATVSRVHAYLLPVGWAVTIRDAGSTNGTFLRTPGDTAWARLEPDLAVPLVPGAQIAVGRHQLRFGSHHNQEPTSAAV